MKPTIRPAAQTKAATSTTATRTATERILGPLKTAALQTNSLGAKRRAASPQSTPSAASNKPACPVHRIVQGDCLEAMAKIPDHAVDFICADFPYNISGKGGMTMRGNTVVKADFGEWDKFPTDEAYLDFVFKVCAEYRRILKPNASMVLFF